MNITANIQIQQISNGYVISDGHGGQYLDGLGIDRSETRHYATLDDLAADAGRFVREAIENQVARMRDYEEKRKAEEEHFARMAVAEQQTATRLQSLNNVEF